MQTASVNGDQPAEAMIGWHRSGDVFWPAMPVLDALPAGVYEGVRTQNGPALKEVELEMDDLVSLPDSASSRILSEIAHFWKLKPAFEARGLIHKRGVLIYGPPGTGKTVTIDQLLHAVVSDGGFGLLIDSPGFGSTLLRMIRGIHPDVPIVAILEDLEHMIDDDDSELVSLLDGEHQVANVVYVATTNHFEKIGPRFVDRPSRFDLLVEVGPPSRASRRRYLAAKEPNLTGEQLDAWADATDGLTVAHLRELIVLCCCYEKTFPEALARIRSMKRQVAKAPESSEKDDD